MEQSRVIFRVHAIKRMFNRRISEADVLHVLKTGENIEQYADDKPFPSRLIMGWAGSRPIHVVVADDNDGKEIIVITVYEPEKNQWTEDFKRRKK